MISPRLALRTLRRTPFVTAVAVASLALGIGANSAIFSVFNELLLRPVAAPDPGSLVNLGAPGPKPGAQSCGQAGGCDEIFSYRMFRDLEGAQATQASFTGIAAHRVLGANLSYQNQVSAADGLLVSGSYFPVLRLRPALGRLFTPEDDKVIGGHFVAVLSYSYWRNDLGAPQDVVNQTILINGQSMTIVGVAPEGFEGTTVGLRPKVFVPISMRGVMSPWFKGFDNRRSYWVYLFARLKPGVSVEQAKRAINVAYKPIINDVEAPLQEGMSDQTLKRFRAKEVTVVDGRRGQTSIQREAKTPIMLLFSITGIVLLIACANIANLLMARGAGRSLEMAVRLSLGAGRWQLLGQLLTESCLLALFGGVVSLLVARWTLAGIMALLPPDASQTLTFGIDSHVVVFAALLSLGTGLLFGLFPALHSTRPDLITAIRANTGQPSGARAASRFRTSLVTAQIALSMSLLILAGLFVKSLFNVSRVELGVKIDRVLTFAINPELNGYSAARSQTLFARVAEEVEALPGVTDVSMALVALLSGDNWGNDVAVEGFRRGPDTDANSRFNLVGPGYFRTLGVPIKAGREFTPADAPDRPKVAVVNEAFVKKFNLPPNPIGKRMGTGRNEEQLDIEIVGLVQNAKYSSVKDEIPPVFVTPFKQDTSMGTANFYVRTTQEPGQLVKSIRSVMAKIDPTLPVVNLKTMVQQVKENVFLDRMIGTLSASFAVLATILAAVGLYGVLAYTVAQRTREIGVRMALGADRRRVRAMVLRQVGVMTLIGAVIGIGGAVGLGQLAQSLLFNLKGHDPLVTVVATFLLAVVAFAAGGIPATRASRVDPMQALRYE
jgi:predicted permease